MKEYTLRLELLTSSLVGSGVGYGAEIDTDIMFDSSGIPFVPAKRIKGCLLDAALEVSDMFLLSGIDIDAIQTEKTFGDPGKRNSAPVYFSNLFINNYRQNKDWLDYFLNSPEYKALITHERILNTFTETRRQTRIGSNGVACAHSLRAIRILRKGLVFYGRVYIDSDDGCLENTLLLACLNFRRFGTKRNRGLGEVRCSLLKNGKELTAVQMLEDVCTD